MSPLVRAASLILFVMAASSASASVLTPLCVFGASTCGGGPAGYNPASPVFRDSSGNLYGTTPVGGAHNGGVVFMLTPGGTYTEIYEFCSAGGASCTDGQSPNGALIMDLNGNLYGTAFAGGAPHSGTPNGVAYELSPPVGGGSTWTYAIIHQFCSSINCTGGGTDGSGPRAGLTYAGQSSGSLYNGTSALYGTTQHGGNPSYDAGTVFKLVPIGGGWGEHIIHQFCYCGSPKADGAVPSSGLYMDGNGVLYGTADYGNSGVGVVYTLTQIGTSWNEDIIYNFCQTAGSPAYCADGESVDTTNVTMDSSGNIYGTTVSGGSSPYLSVNGGGVLFKLLNPANNMGNWCTYGAVQYWCESVVYSFCTFNSACIDGANPSGGTGLFIDSLTGSMYGTTTNGGANTTSNAAYGVLFKVHGTAEHTLHSFCNTASSCTDGQLPMGGLIRDSSGNFYGTTVNGGGLGTSPPYYGYGIVYEFTP